MTILKKTSVCAIILTFLLASLGSANASSDEPNELNELSALFAHRMQMLRESKKAIPKEIVEKYGYKIIPVAEPYLQDSNFNVRSAAYGIIWSAGRRSKDTSERQHVVEKLLAYSFNDRRFKGSMADRLLSSFRAVDYSETAKQMLKEELASSPVYRTILLVGAADMNLPLLKQFVDDVNEPLEPFGVFRKASHGRAFAAMMARGRMGIKEDVQRCIDLVESHPDERFRVGVLLDRISYIRQPEVVQYLKRYLMMDKTEDSKVSLRKTYAQRAARALSKILEDFPRSKDGKSMAPRELVEYQRKWMSEQTEWNIIR